MKRISKEFFIGVCRGRGVCPQEANEGDCIECPCFEKLPDCRCEETRKVVKRILDCKGCAYAGRYGANRCFKCVRKFDKEDLYTEELEDNE